MYDIGIIGAGPAGATLARLAGKNHRVLLLNSCRPKCCGGILAHEAQKKLANLDLSLPRSVLVDPQPFAVTIFDRQSDLTRYYPRQYVNIDRLKFDQWLISLIPDSVDMRLNSIYRGAEFSGDIVDLDSADDSGFVTIHFTEGDQKRSAKVRRLVGADGAASLVRHHFFQHHKLLKKYIAIQDWFDKDNINFDSKEDSKDDLKDDLKDDSHNINFCNDYVGIFDNNITDFYCWTIPKNDCVIVGGAFPLLPDARVRFDKFKLGINELGLKTNQAKKRESALIVRPMSTSAICLGRGQILLIGEAAGLISPTSAEGISYALASAQALNQALNSKKNILNEYKKNAKKLIWNIKLKYIKSPAMFNPFLRKLVMKSGLTTIKKS
ncbi:MAG: hypothetical protein LBQ66_11245 [Planctomycetaceae bacterium]|jgi:flavin-dependent dehydrogenase|nr:hypothetical protein [Planctomycetaceae bacterium]